MDTIKRFIKTHLKKIIGGAVLTVITFGIYGVYKVCKNKVES